LDPNVSDYESESLVNWIPIHKKIYSFLKKVIQIKICLSRDMDSRRNVLDDESESLVNWIPVHKKIYYFS
jgi:hypothetical protein